MAEPLNPQQALDLHKMPNGSCPLKSTGSSFPINSEVILKPSQQIAQAHIEIPCTGGNCHLWSIEDKHCQIINLVNAVRDCNRQLYDMVTVGLGAGLPKDTKERNLGVMVAESIDKLTYIVTWLFKNQIKKK